MSQLNEKITIKNTRREPADQAFKEKAIALKEKMTSVERSNIRHNFFIKQSGTRLE